MRNGPRAVRQPTLRLSTARSAILAYLIEVGSAVSVKQIAAAIGQHVNTVREHLDALAAAGLVQRGENAPQGRGRPAWLYRATDSAAAQHPSRQYAALVGALAGQLRRVASDPVAEARKAGREWARELVPEGASDPVATMQGWGFSPVTDAPGRVRLTTCPVLAAAQRDPDIVCNLHQGALQGLSDTRFRLTPFVAGGCLMEAEPA